MIFYELVKDIFEKWPLFFNRAIVRFGWDYGTEDVKFVIDEIVLATVTIK